MTPQWAASVLAMTGEMPKGQGRHHHCNGPKPRKASGPPRGKPRGEPFTPQMLQQARKLRAAGLTWLKVGQALGRNQDSLRKALERQR